MARILSYSSSEGESSIDDQERPKKLSQTAKAMERMKPSQKKDESEEELILELVCI